MIWHKKEIEEILSVKLNSGDYINQVQFNSKNIEKNDIFVALSGSGLVDGHDFVDDALIRGASYAIVSRDVHTKFPGKLIMVPDSMEALVKLAMYKRNQSKAKFIVITGSVGKTTTKDAIKLMCEKFGKTFAGRGNFNNFLGLMINLASMPPDINYAIIEIGMNKAGEIRELARYVSPDVAIITNIFPVHLEFFDSIEMIADAKCEIFHDMRNNGLVIINGETEYERCANNLKNSLIEHVNIFGYNSSSHSKIISVKKNNKNLEINYLLFGEEIKLQLPLLSFHFAEIFAICLLVAHYHKFDIDVAISQLKLFRPVLGRGNVVEVVYNKLNTIVICDYYNASPISMNSALSYLRLLEHERKIAIIGDMMELGDKSSEKMHLDLILPILASNTNKLVLVGNFVKIIYEKLVLYDYHPKINIYLYDNVDQVINDIEKIIEGGELILIKASRSLKLEKIAKYLGVKNAL